MMFSKTRKQCANGSDCKQTAVTNCEGCSKAFCVKHFNDHRRLLDEEMNIIVSEHDDLKNLFNQRTVKLHHHHHYPLVTDIDSWGKEAIAKIRQRAKMLREELVQLTTAYENELSKRFQQLTEKLKESRENEDFLEIDLQYWKQSLNDLKIDLISSSIVSLNHAENVPLVSDISVSSYTITNDTFERMSNGTVQIQGNGELAVRGKVRGTTEVRGKNDYRLGCQKIRLLIEQFAGGWLFFGINSKSTPIQDVSYECISTYGWSNNNCFWSHGSASLIDSGRPIEMKMNDIITLLFDCDNRKIAMTNERTKVKHELQVDTDYCPFPWQLHINLCEANTRVRILHT